MKHIISYSGGAASFVTGHMVVEKHGKENVLFGFADTLIEDGDLYRFLVFGAAALMGVEISNELKQRVLNVPAVYDATRPAYLESLSKLAMREIKQLIWLIDGRDPWQVFKDERYQGNTRIAHCTVELKGKMFWQFVGKWFDRRNCIVYFGFDWAEAHRLDTARENCWPFKAESPLIDPPFFSRAQIRQVIDDYDLPLPRLYEMGFTHNNCGGFCVKAGQGHFANLLEKMPDVYEHHEAKQQKLMEAVPNVRPFLRMTVNKKLEYLTLKQYREHLQGGGEYLKGDTGGCNCFSDTGMQTVEEMLKEIQFEVSADGWKKAAVA